MFKGIIGKKVGMTQIFMSDGTVIPVTVVEAGPCVVVQKKTVETDGYNALQLGFGKILKAKKVNKPMAGHFKKNNLEFFKFLKEFRTDNVGEFEVGQEIKVDIFTEGELVDVQGVSIGKGFQGVIKRHGFAGGPASHGSDFHRAPGSIGMCEFPGETLKGKKMPGRMGNKTVTTQGLKIAKVMADKNVLLIKGSVPGHKNGIIYIKKSTKSNN
ncbi:50S ribosomal protein L3 [Deferribacteraceae bacterium V6Fe1]|jgi:large subunit ribosomal protein L3|uniref:50S ribosomal protein L3 n=1 Tax=Deferrivibrio essentukiensis TaxID=2880922 RepID=UPI0019CEE521|nr:50S ribosomal protein L3 [Deferrivibrio essentukiensis]MBC7195730.1 50S ribosomal protein L3 [Deferribacterales bacterium]MBZ4672519.1 ribosomal protein [Deferribacteraceae bacterium]MCB4205124.1 50S ribosomal protein L3 [Deferrivibrio essentukiensis]UOD33758.1 50S ribosomal protein L3 [Deferribacteraceae bacterium V6Fe1]